jgi:hypothetical protein
MLFLHLCDVGYEVKHRLRKGWSIAPSETALVLGAERGLIEKW